jgi:tetratricopeptide (TPR) repeat protein
MLTKKLIISILTIGMALLQSCKNDTTQPEIEDNTAIALNDKAMQQLYNAKDTNDVYLALYTLDQAISLDSTFIPAYINKVNTLLQLKKIDKALSCIQTINRQGTFPEYIMFEGFMHERWKEDTITAQNLYHRALQAYDSVYAQTQDSTLLFNKGFVVLMTEGKERGLVYYDSLLQHFPNNTLLQSMKEQAKDFDKQRFLIDLW